MDENSKIFLAVQSFKSSTTSSCKPYKEVWNQPQGDCESPYNQNHLNPGSDFPTDHLTTARSFAPTC